MVFQAAVGAFLASTQATRHGPLAVYLALVNRAWASCVPSGSAGSSHAAWRVAEFDDRSRRPRLQYRSEDHHHEWKSAPHRNPSTSAPQRETEQAAREPCGGAGGRARRDRSEAAANVFALLRHEAVQVVPTTRRRSLRKSGLATLGAPTPLRSTWQGGRTAEFRPIPEDDFRVCDVGERSDCPDWPDDVQGHAAPCR